MRCFTDNAAAVIAAVPFAVAALSMLVAVFVGGPV